MNLAGKLTLWRDVALGARESGARAEGRVESEGAAAALAAHGEARVAEEEARARGVLEGDGAGLVRQPRPNVEGRAGGVDGHVVVVDHAPALAGIVLAGKGEFAREGRGRNRLLRLRVKDC